MPSTPAATSELLRLLKEGLRVGAGSEAGIQEWQCRWVEPECGQCTEGDGRGLLRPKKKVLGEADASFLPLD